MEHLFDGGVTARKFAAFVTPSVIMLVFIALYYLIDAIFVANFVSSDALAAINIVYPISGLGWGISVMLAAGSSAIVAIRMGEGKAREADEKFSLICYVTVILGILAAVLGLVFLDEVVGFLGATDRLWAYCMDYAWILVIALPAAFLGVLLEYFIRVDGRPGFTLFLYLSGGIVHIFLDYVFLALWDWGIAGAGWATAAGQATIMVLGIAYFVTQKTKLTLVIPKWDIAYIKDCIVNGSSEMVSESSVAITVYVFNTIVLGLAGEDGVAALSIVLNAHYLLISAHLGFITGAGPLISYYYGAKDYGKVNLFLKYSRTFILISSVGVALLALLEAPLLARVFVESDTEVYHMAVRGVRMIAAAFLFTGVNVFATGFFVAYGNGITATLISLSRGPVMVIIGAVTLPRLFGLDGVWLTVCFAEIITVALSVFMFNKYKDIYHYSLTGTGTD
jgi:putative MATE family efflux protein